ncbi:MAG: hypothetical protein HUJ27_00210 [Rhodobacteraceae bacterium]|nr:hypothetical protein [Paracoccaceae bacterium]
MNALSNSLNEALEQMPGCVFVGYLDLSVGMVLGSAALGEIPEELQENLGVSALNYLNGKSVRALAESLGGSSESFDEALVAVGGATHVFIRLPERPNHVLCFMFPGEGDPRPLLQIARQTVESFSLPDFLE